MKKKWLKIIVILEFLYFLSTVNTAVVVSKDQDCCSDNECISIAPSGQSASCINIPISCSANSGNYGNCYFTSPNSCSDWQDWGPCGLPESNGKCYHTRFCNQNQQYEIGECTCVTPTSVGENPRPTATPKPPSPSPTSRPTSTPGPTLTSVPNCPLKNKGDANCDCKIDEADFVVWKSEFIAAGGGAKTASFDLNDKVDLADYEIWRKYSASINMVEIECNGISLPPPTQPPAQTGTPIPTKTPTPTPTPIEFEDTFNSEDSLENWKLVEGEGSIFVENGKMRVVSSDDVHIKCEPCSEPDNDYILNVTVVNSSEPSNLNGFVFNYTDPGNYCIARVSASKLWHVFCKKNHEIKMEKNGISSQIKDNNNVLKLSLTKEGMLTFYINNEKIFSDICMPLQGSVGLYSQFGTTYFDDFKLNSL